MPDNLYIHKFKTNLGWFRVASTDKGLAIVDFINENEFNRTIKKRFPDSVININRIKNAEAQKQIKAYLSGKLKIFTLTLDISGTPFQRKVLRKVNSIPYGTTATYGEIAVAVGHPKALRAIGTVNAGNRLPIIIPCHRIVAVNGLGGYTGGLDLKKRLLMLEGVDV